MSRLLQRLASQALGAGVPRVRSAAAVHAQAPIALPVRERAAATQASPVFDAAASAAESRTSPEDRHDAGAAQVHDRVEFSVDRVSRDEAARPFADAMPDPQAPRAPVAPSPVPLQSATDERVVAWAVPTPLLAEFASPPGSQAPTSAIRPSAPQEVNQRASAAPTEVHVHIGRIEVTALHQPTATPPRRRDRPARQTVPLSDYLAKRGPS